MTSPGQDQVNQVLMRIYRALWESDPTQFRPGEGWRPAGLFELQQHLPAMIDEARYAREMNWENVCRMCFHQTGSGICLHRDRCIVRRHAGLIYQAIQETTPS
jgi:hypothetical protein